MVGKYIRDIDTPLEVLHESHGHFVDSYIVSNSVLCSMRSRQMTNSSGNDEMVSRRKPSKSKTTRHVRHTYDMPGSDGIYGGISPLLEVPQSKFHGHFDQPKISFQSVNISP
jgi:hypothetical protein